MIPYNTRWMPPAPLLDVLIQNPFLSNLSLVKLAVLDIGADISAIPQSVVQPLHLEATRTIGASGVDDIVLQRTSYIVNLQVADRMIERIRVIEWPGDEILLGRDVLNDFEIRLDGKTRQFEIRDP